MEEELSTAFRAAADALEILSNLRPGFTRNVIPRMNSTAVSDSQPDNGDRQVNEELQSKERAIQSLTLQASSSSIQNRLATLFPTVGKKYSRNRASRKGASGRPVRSKQTIKSTKGRPSKTLFCKDLILIPSALKINKVPTHTTRHELEERELVWHDFPFSLSHY